MKPDHSNISFEDFIQNLPANFSVLPEPVAIEVQMEYFDVANKVRKEARGETALQGKDMLFDGAVSIADKKQTLSRIASVPSPEAFRVLQKYSARPDPELREWSVLALQENKLLLESSLLNTQQVFISTGLGGRGSVLRFFVVFVHTGGTLESYQQKMLREELSSGLKNNGGELEEMAHFDRFTTATILMPITVDMGRALGRCVEECNQYGNFLGKGFLVTNVKKMTEKEVLDVLDNHRQLPEEQHL